MIFIFQGFQTILFIFIVIFTTSKLKDVIWSSVSAPELDKHLKKAEDILAETLWI